MSYIIYIEDLNRLWISADRHLIYVERA